MVFATPVSWAMTCCVRRAIRTASSVGSASASSYELVCSDCVPPSTPASASIAVRTMLLSGCWAVRLTPAGCGWKRRGIGGLLLGGEADARRLRVEAHEHRALVLGAVRVAQLAGPDAARGAVLGDLLEE